METNSTTDERIRVPRNLRTPITEAAEALMKACDFWLWLVGETGSASKLVKADPETYFFEELFGKTFSDPETNGDLAVEKIGALLDGSYAEDGSAPFALIQVMCVVVDYCVQAMNAEKSGEHQLAWTFACDAQYWAGILCAEHTREKEPSSLSINAVNAAIVRWQTDPRHSEKKFIQECWREWKRNPNQYKSKAAFARDMLEKCEHLVSSKIIEDWCRDWEKQ